LLSQGNTQGPFKVDLSSWRDWKKINEEGKNKKQKRKIKERKKTNDSDGCGGGSPHHSELRKRSHPGVRAKPVGKKKKRKEKKGGYSNKRKKREKIKF